LETFCITAIEAQAAGTPAVVSDYGCLRDRVGNAGIVIGGIKDLAHEEAFIEAVVRLANDDVL
jgi:glycosyltransferase involved in cell wall biosynthesis